MCETTRTHQQPQPLGIYMMVDQSNAMFMQWTDVSAALQGFIVDSGKLGGVSVGAQYYALSPTAPNNPDSICDWTRYAAPDVQILPLSSEIDKDALLGSIASHGPPSLLGILQNLSLGALFNESPTDAALRGAVAGARNWATANAQDHPKASVLLVTTGVPDPQTISECHPTLDAAVQAATDGFEGTPSVTTYVLGVGGPNPNLDAIASAGATERAYAVTSGHDVVEALQSIREVALPCDVSVSDTNLVDQNVNVELTLRGSLSVDYVSVAGAGACDAVLPAGVGGEWFVDGTGSIATVRLCPSTCEEARATVGASLDVILGCPTHVLLK